LGFVECRGKLNLFVKRPALAGAGVLLFFPED
jgi:hypothetical protein